MSDRGDYAVGASQVTIIIGEFDDQRFDLQIVDLNERSCYEFRFHVPGIFVQLLSVLPSWP